MAHKGDKKKAVPAKKVREAPRQSAQAVAAFQVALPRFNVGQLFGLIDALDNNGNDVRGKASLM